MIWDDKDIAIPVMDEHTPKQYELSLPEEPVNLGQWFSCCYTCGKYPPPTSDGKMPGFTVKSVTYEDRDKWGRVTKSYKGTILICHSCWYMFIANPAR